ncbi:MAG: hypothetical protein LBD27_01405, partial [Tannerella sp.]|nr:hypothetical protein [Tannerella sp.]
MKQPLFVNFMSRLMFVVVACLAFACGGDRETGGKDSAKRKNITETGELAAINIRSFVLPRFGRYWYQMRIIGILEHGSIVNAGDSVIQLDPTEIKRLIIEQESTLETELANLEKLHVNHSIRINELTTNIKNETASFDLKKIELESSRFETERLRKIKELEFQQSQIALNKEKRRLGLTEIIQKNQLKIQDIRVRQIETEINNAYDILPALTLRSPIAGVFQIAKNWSTEKLVKVGDNIYTGNNMANVPDLEWMKVNTF